ncbi:hypothetical protein ACWD2L_00365 [Streptomyces sp. NPDC002754]
MTTGDTPITFTDDGRELWDQQTGESDAQYRRYTRYQLLGGARSVRAVAEEIGMSASYLHNIAHRYRWRERAKAWDREQDRLFLDKLADERKRIVDEQLKLSRSMLVKVAARLKDLNPDELTPGDLSRWAQVLTQIQRQALGEPDRVAVSGTPGAAPITVTAVSADPAARALQFEELRTSLEHAIATPIGELDPAELLDDDD